MERAIRPKGKLAFVLVWGVLVWGGLTALGVALFDRYTIHRHEAAFQIVGTFVIFMAMGVPLGLRGWTRANAVPKKVNRRAEIVRVVLFWGLMIGLACVLWVMARR